MESMRLARALLSAVAGKAHAFFLAQSLIFISLHLSGAFLAVHILKGSDNFFNLSKQKISGSRKCVKIPIQANPEQREK